MNLTLISTGVMVFLILLLSPNVQAQFDFTINNGAVTITGYTGADTNLTIPGKLGGLPVTAIGDQAFFYSSALTRVTIPNGVTRIGSEAFSGCFRLATVNLPDSLRSLGDGAFSRCEGLVSVTIPSNVTNLGAETFMFCQQLPSINIPSHVPSIEAYSFANCTSLTNITISESVTSIGESAFLNCRNLTAIKVDALNSSYCTVTTANMHSPLLAHRPMEANILAAAPPCKTHWKFLAASQRARYISIAPLLLSKWEPKFAVLAK